MAIFITGATGYIGSYVTDWLLRNTDHELALLVRAPDYDAGVDCLWQALQLHMEPELFARSLDRVCFISGDLTQARLGVSEADYDWLISNAESSLHNASSPISGSEEECLNQNLKGTLSVIKLARAIEEDHPLRRFTEVSTVGVAGKRVSTLVGEDEPLDWSRSDYDSFTRSKKFCEHMVRELLSDVPCLYLRHASVLGDARFPETTQFGIVRAMCVLADLPLLPLSPDARVDVVNADWVGASIAELHLREDLRHDTFHLSAGTESRTVGEIGAALAAQLGRKPFRFGGRLSSSFELVMKLVAHLPSRGPLKDTATLLSLLMPYLTTDVIYDNKRAIAALGTEPTPFTSYCGPLYGYAKSVGYRYPYRSFPDELDLSNVPAAAVRPLA